MNADDPILRPTQVFVWMLCLSDTTFTAYCDLAPAEQLALAASYGLDREGLAVALEQVTVAYRARLEQLRETYQARRRGSH